MASRKASFVITSKSKPSRKVNDLADEFMSQFQSLESENGSNTLLLFDEKSKAFYIPCHLKSVDFCDKCDLNATLDDEDDESYKLNRDIQENENAFQIMKADAVAGRSFEDIVVEFDRAYSPKIPLKIYGGQHRIKAIQSAQKKKPNTHHGFRVYLGLTKEQKVEIATINNTSITVSGDLLDRVRESLAGEELRDYCQQIGLLNKKQNFSDKNDSTIPTVRIARTFVVNFWKGESSSFSDFHVPYVCKLGGMDDEYYKVREKIDWKDKDFIEAGTNFSKLHKAQRQKVTSRKTNNLAQFAKKAISLAVVAAWSFAAGLYNQSKNKQKILYELINGLGTQEDPLNAKALSEAKLKNVDPEAYRGLGARINNEELGRMLELFIVFIEKSTDKKISKQLANAAILSYQAKKANNKAESSFANI